MQNICLSNCLNSFQIAFICHKYRRGLSDEDRNVQWNSDFSNLHGKWKLVRKIGSSKNRRWHQITPVLPWYCFIRSKKADNNVISLLLMCEPSLFTNKTCI